MSDQMTSKDSLSAISLQESQAGVTRSDLQDGPILDLFGQEVVPASHLASRERKKRNQMSVTYGRIGLGSSESQNLQRFLVNKLKTELPLDGGMMSVAIWKKRITPARRVYYQLIVSRHHMEEIGFFCGKH
jgi:hypothetical protein